MDIAIFGGSFDPPHKGHEQIVKKALDSLCIKKLFIVPTYLSPFKKKFAAPPQLRLYWLKKLFTCKSVKIIDYEVKMQQEVPTIETIKFLKKNYVIDKIYLIIGADNLASLHKWRSYDKLKNMVEFVIASRYEIVLPKELKKLPINVKISSSKLRSEMDISFIPHKIADEVIEFYKDKNGK